MTGDEIVAEFAGEVYSARITTTSAVQRFSATSLRLKHVYIKEFIGSYSSYIGLYNADRTTFLASAFPLDPYGAITLQSVDLYNLGHAWSSAAAHYGLIGTY